MQSGVFLVKKTLSLTKKKREGANNDARQLASKTKNPMWVNYSSQPTKQGGFKSANRRDEIGKPLLVTMSHFILMFQNPKP